MSATGQLPLFGDLDELAALDLVTALAALDLARYERWAAREQAKLASLPHAPGCRCDRPLVLDRRRSRCSKCGRETP